MLETIINASRCEKLPVNSIIKILPVTGALTTAAKNPAMPQTVNSTAHSVPNSQLDEPNVDRFAGYLKRLKGNTQIIAITHRRGTMQAAETLYGITMQEKGVSTLVSVDLS